VMDPGGHHLLRARRRDGQQPNQQATSRSQKPDPAQPRTHAFPLSQPSQRDQTGTPGPRKRPRRAGEVVCYPEGRSRNSWPSSTVTVGPTGGVVGGWAWTSDSQVSGPNTAEVSMMPLVSQIPGPTGMPSRPGGSSWAILVAVAGSTPTAP